MMMNALCHSGDFGSFGNLAVFGGIGLILNLIFWVGLIAGLTLLVIKLSRNARVPGTAGSGLSAGSAAGGQNTAKEILQAQYARGEINREQYESKKQDIG